MLLVKKHRTDLLKTKFNEDRLEIINEDYFAYLSNIRWHMTSDNISLKYVIEHFNLEARFLLSSLIADLLAERFHNAEIFIVVRFTLIEYSLTSRFNFLKDEYDILSEKTHIFFEIIIPLDGPPDIYEITHYPSTSKVKDKLQKFYKILYKQEKLNLEDDFS